MTDAERQQIVKRLLTGQFAWPVRRLPSYVSSLLRQYTNVLIFKHPSGNLKLAQERYRLHQIEELSDRGLPSTDDLLNMAIQRRLWSPIQDKAIDATMQAIEQLRAKMGAALQSQNLGSLASLKRKLNQLKDKLEQLWSKKQDILSHSLETTAEHRARQWMMPHITYTHNDELLYDLLPKDSRDDRQIMEALSYAYYVEGCLSAKQLREVARTQPWRSHWHASKHLQIPLFRVQSTYDLADEQLDIISWSLLYDSVYEAIERPPQSVIDDDDLLDAWLSHQAKQHDMQSAKKKISEAVNKHPRRGAIRDVMIPVNVQDPDEVMALAGPDNQLRQEQAMRLLAKRGQVSDYELQKKISIYGRDED